MSRIGSKPILVPDGMKVLYENGMLSAEYSGKMCSFNIPSYLVCTVGDGMITLSLHANSASKKGVKGYWGLYRSNIENAIKGIFVAFEETLYIDGVGYRAAISKDGRVLEMSLGFSHGVEFMLPDGITATVNGNVLKVAGHDKCMLGMVVAGIRSIRKPEPYKGKGIRRAGEFVLRKEGKK